MWVAWDDNHTTTTRREKGKRKKEERKNRENREKREKREKRRLVVSSRLEQPSKARIAREELRQGQRRPI